MIIYIENQIKNHPQTQKIIKKFPKFPKIFINNYKNVFDKNFINTKKSIVIAKLNSSAITEAPVGYGHTKKAYFFKTSLNCIFDCSYCFLKGAFKNENMVFFINYEDILKQIEDKILENTNSEEDLWFYSSDYSDILGMNGISDFSENFIEFFEKFEGVKMEIRTKSSNISSLKKLDFVPKNTEIAFSLNPQILIDKYETGTSSLDDRIKAINELISMGFKVGLRFLPLLPVKNYKEIYQEFIEKLQLEIDFNKIESTFASGLLYTKRDYNNIIKKFPDLDVLHYLELENDDFYREARSVREDFYKMFKSLDNKCMLCLEN